MFFFLFIIHLLHFFSTLNEPKIIFAVRQLNSIVLKIRLSFLLIVLFFAGIEANAQSYSITKYNSTSFLPNELVKAVYKDSKGLVWIGTDNGLFQFDGVNYEDISNGLPEKKIKSIIGIGNDELLIATDLGIVSTSTNDAPNYKLIIAGNKQQTDTSLWYPKTFYLARDSSVWIGDNASIYNIKAGKVKRYNMPASEITSNYLRSFSFCEIDNRGVIVATIRGKLYRINKTNDALKPIEWDDKHEKFFSHIAAFGKNTVLLASNDGLWKLTLEHDKVEQSICLDPTIDPSFILNTSTNECVIGSWSKGLFLLKHDYPSLAISKINSVTTNNINYIYSDPIGNDIWLSTDVGLMLLQSNIFSQVGELQINEYIQSIAAFQHGILVASDKYVFEIDENHYTTKRFEHPNGIVLQALEKGDSLIMGDNNGNLIFSEKNKKTVFRNLDNKAGSVFLLRKDHNNNLWFLKDGSNGIFKLTPDGQWKEYGAADGLNKRPISIYVTSDNRVLLGTIANDAYLFEFDAKSDRFKDISKPCSFATTITLAINDIVVNERQKIFLASNLGLITLDKDSGQLVDLNEFTKDEIKAIQLDASNNFWLATGNGLIKYKNGLTMLFDEKTGLPSKLIGYRELFVDNKANIWVGTVAGIGVANTVAQEHKTGKPNLHKIERNGSRYVDAEFVFTTEDAFTFSFYNSTYPVQLLDIQYRLIDGNGEAAWILFKSRTPEVALKKLKQGNFTLQIKAKRRGNFKWSDAEIIDFEVVKPWYMRFYNLLLFILIGAGIVTLVSYITSKKLLEDKKNLELLVDSRTKEVVNQALKIDEQNRALSQQNEELIFAKMEAEKAAKAKTNFLSTMSHELRTPLNAVVGISNLLKRSEPRADQEENIDLLLYSSKNLLNLINDILDFNKIEDGKITLEKIDFNFKKLCSNIVKTYDQLAKEKGIKLLLEFDDVIPPVLKSDPVRLNQVLTNLIGNAIKFTTKGEVKLKVNFIEKYNDQKVILNFAISDTGIGIPKDKQILIFDRFSQASEDITRKYGGTGLGLAISKRIVENFGSSIVLNSVPDKGSVFSFSLQLEVGDPANITDEIAQKDVKNILLGKKVLLVDDNKTNEMIAERFLTFWGIEVTAANNGLDAVRLALENDYDLILMDIHMPDINGFEATKRIRTFGTDTRATVPVMALTASVLAPEEYKEYNMNDFLLKPFQPEEFFAKIYGLLQPNDKL